MSSNLPLDMRAVLVARVNGLFDGRLAPESFVLSQAYLYGSVNSNPAHRVEVIDGDFIDLRTDLDSGAMGKSPTDKSARATGGGQLNPERARATVGARADDAPRTDEELHQLLEATRIEGEWHKSMLLVTASLIGRGYPDSRIKLICAPYFNAGFTDQDFADLLDGARKKWGKPNEAGISGVTFRDCYKGGIPKPSLANAVIAIRALGITASYDLFHHRINVSYKGDAKTIREGLLTDDTISAVRSLINNTYRFDCGDNITFAAIKEVARDNAFDPVLDMLDDCQAKWDGKKRLDTWVIDYWVAKDTPLNRAIGRLVLIAACRRARVPGCKFDNITNLEGPEGINKSTAIRVLAGDDYFSDQSIIGANSKEVQEQLDGEWMHENADLAGMRKADVDKVNAFASRQVDRARPAYGRVQRRSATTVHRVGHHQPRRIPFTSNRKPAVVATQDNQDRPRGGDP